VDLTPGQQERIQHLLVEELRDAVRAALDRHDSAAVDEFVADRRRGLEQLVRASTNDLQDPLDQDSEGGGVAEQR
jgi:hypothetical protein